MGVATQLTRRGFVAPTIEDNGMVVSITTTWLPAVADFRSAYRLATLPAILDHKVRCFQFLVVKLYNFNVCTECPYIVAKVQMV